MTIVNLIFTDLRNTEKKFLVLKIVRVYTTSKFYDI